MKFVRLSEFNPQRTPETIEAINFYQSTYELMTERREAFLKNGRTVTASIKFLDIKIAQLMKEAADSQRTKMLEEDFTYELGQIRKKFAGNPEEMVNAIKSWIDKKGVKDFLLTHIYNDVMPSTMKKLTSGFEGMPPLTADDAEEAVNDALTTFFDLDNPKSLVQSLLDFDASKGSLMTWINGGFVKSARQNANHRLKQRKKETSINDTVGDDNTEIADLIPNTSSDSYDLGGYLDKANAYYMPYQKMLNNLQTSVVASDIIAKGLQYAQNTSEKDSPDNIVSANDNDLIKKEKRARLDEKIQKAISAWSAFVRKEVDKIEDKNAQKDMRMVVTRMFDEMVENMRRSMPDSMRNFFKEQNSSVGSNKSKFQTQYTRITNDDNGFKGYVDELIGLGKTLDEVGEQLAEVSSSKSKAARMLSQPGLSPEAIANFSEKLRMYTEREKELKENHNVGAKKFQDIASNIQNIDYKYNSEGGTLLPEDMPQANVDEVTVEPSMPSDAPAVETVKKLRTKPVGKRQLLSPEDRAILVQQMEETRNKVLPAFYRTLGFPEKGKVSNPGLFKSLALTKNIQSPEDYEALKSGNLENASAQAKITDIIVKGLLYTRDMAALDNAYSSEIEENIGGRMEMVGGGSKPSRDIQRFWDFVHQELEKYNDPELYQQGVATLMTLIKDISASKASGGAAQFRELYDKTDFFARAAAYEEARERMFGNKDWDELSDDERKAIAQDVFSSQYGVASRSLHVAKPNKVEPRYPLHPDVTGEKYIDLMMKELWRLGHGKARSRGRADLFPEEQYAQYRDPSIKNRNWFEIMSDPNAFRNRDKIKSPSDMSGQVGFEGGQDADDETIAKIMIDTIVRIAESLDKLGEYRKADTIVRELKTVYGQV